MSLTPDLTEFIYRYHIVDRAWRECRIALTQVFHDIRSEVATGAWHTADFVGDSNDRLVRVWHRHWHPRSNPKVPWVHFEYGINVVHRKVEGRLDVEPAGAARESVVQVGDALRSAISATKHPWVSKDGWEVEKRRNPRQYIVLYKQVPFPDQSEEFSDTWIREQARTVFESLSRLIDAVSQEINKLKQGR